MYQESATLVIPSSVLYKVPFHHFERFVAEYESRFERDYVFLRPIVKDVTEGHHRAVVIS